MSLAPFAAALVLAAATPPCELAIQRVEPIRWSGRTGAGYDPLDAVERVQEGRLRVAHAGAACEFSVAVEGYGSERRAQGPGGALLYRLTNAASRPLETLPLVPGGGLRGSFADGEGARTSEFRLSVPPGQQVAAGIYRDEVLLRLFAGSGEELLELDTALLQLTIEVRPSLEVRLEGLAGGGRVLDLGDLMHRASRTFTVVIRGNSPFRLRVLSAGGGFLVPEGSADGSRVPYRLRLQGRDLSLRGEEAYISRAEPGLASTAITVEIAVEAGAAAGAAAGAYRDSLTFSIEAE